MLKYLPAMLLGAFLTTQPALAAEKNETVEQATQKVLSRIFSAAEKAVVEEYFNVDLDEGAETGKKGRNGLPPGLAKRKTLPPGLAKRKQLPPGLQEHVKIGKTLPPEVVRDYAVGLPQELLEALGLANTLFSAGVVGDDVLLINKSTFKVHDIIKGGAVPKHAAPKKSDKKKG